MNNTKSAILLATLLVASISLTGCNILGWMAAPYGSDIEITEVTAQYTKLKDKSVAVLVAADDSILFMYPDARFRVSHMISQRLSENIDSITLMKPKDVKEFQRENPYWHTSAYPDLLDAVGTDAIIIIELNQYRTHEPGNNHQWRGSVAGTVTLIDAGAPDPSEAVFHQIVRNQFPEDSKVGALDSNDVAIQQGMNTLFSRDAAGLFYDHEVKRLKK
ncbi:hypothetical protein [Poriferisphaera sp. WC338]|uniref:hypothetical protein n=1 Tax=Poriferisphaera sp. WC338 TaxID=3425129 RepID=UPI003D817745